MKEVQAIVKDLRDNIEKEEIKEHENGGKRG